MVIRWFLKPQEIYLFQVPCLVWSFLKTRVSVRVDMQESCSKGSWFMIKRKKHVQSEEFTVILEWFLAIKRRSRPPQASFSWIQLRKLLLLPQQVVSGMIYLNKKIGEKIKPKQDKQTNKKGIGIGNPWIIISSSHQKNSPFQPIVPISLNASVAPWRPSRHRRTRRPRQRRHVPRHIATPSLEAWRRILASTFWEGGLWGMVGGIRNL